MPQDFYPFVENGETPAAGQGGGETIEVRHPARVAVYDDASAAPRVVVIEPKDVRSYLEEITATVTKLAREQGGTIPFMVIREIVENFIHAYFQAPTITILDGGNTIRFSDQGPGIKEKPLALEYGTSSATEEMKRYIRGVGSGLPYAQQYMEDKGGSLEVEDNISGGTVVTLSTRPAAEARGISGAEKNVAPEAAPQPAMPQPAWQQPVPQQGWWPQAAPQQPWPAYAQQMPWPTAQQPPAQPYAQQPYAQQSMPQQPYAQQPAVPQAQPAPQPEMAQPTPQPAAAAVPPQLPTLNLDERSASALALLAERGSAGPSDLTRAYGSSGPTWSRVLSNLAAQGLVTKVGQKYQLTGIGRSFV